MVEKIEAWFKKTGKKSPKSILFFRDGLGPDMYIQGEGNGKKSYPGRLQVTGMD
jgi:hypothetical protein